MRIGTFFVNLWRKIFPQKNTSTMVVLVDDTAIAPAETPEINIGDTAINPDHRWITTMNPKGRPNGNGFRKFGEDASILEGGELTVVAIDGENILVSYKSARGQGYGAEAGNGTLFFLPKHVFAGMTDRYHRIVESREQQKVRVIALLQNTLAAETDSPSSKSTS